MAQPALEYDGGFWYAVRAAPITIDVYENAVADDDAGTYDPGTFVETITVGVRPAAPGSSGYCAWGPINIPNGPPAARGDWFLIRSPVPLDLPEGYSAADYTARVGWLPDDLPFARTGGV